MKIAYIISSDIARYRGSTLKVKNQAETWKSLGHEVEIFSLTPDNAEPLIATTRHVKRSNPFLDKFIPYRKFIADVDLFNPDIVYFRYSLPNATFKRLQRKYPSVIEINTDDRTEYKRLFIERRGLKNLFLWLLNSLLRTGFLKRTDGLVAVTKELSEKPAFRKLNSNIRVVPNSVSLDASPLKKNDDSNGPVKLFFIGSPGLRWHGTDKLEQLADLFKNELEIHIVGGNGKSKKNLFWYGYLSEEEYLKILSRCHICIGTLSLYRKGLNEACPLKVREYLKYGFPIILGYRDTVFLKERPLWVLELPNTNAPFSTPGTADKFLTFCRNYRQFVVPREEVRPFIDSTIIEEKRLGFFKKVIK